MGGWVSWVDGCGVLGFSGYWIVLGPVSLFLRLFAISHLAHGSSYVISVIPPAQLSACAVRSYCTVIRCPHLLPLEAHLMPLAVYT